MSIPLPDSGYRYRDLVLHDGAPIGHRMLGKQKIFTYACLALLQTSPYATWVAELEFSSAIEADAAIKQLAQLAAERKMSVEDWRTSVQGVCQACTEGRPHLPHDRNHAAKVAPNKRRLGIAARSADKVQRLIEQLPSSAAVRKLELGLAANGS
jgi:hypothetical protein